MPDRISETADIIAHALREFRKLQPTDWDGHSEVLARLLMERLGSTERRYLFAAVCKAVPAKSLDKMAHEVVGIPPFDV